MASDLVRLVSETTGKMVVAQLSIADSFWSRLAGLQFRRPLPSDAGLLLVPCNSVHTCFVRFPVDVVFLDDRGCVLAVRRNLRPWRLAVGTAQEPCRAGGDRGSADVQLGEIVASWSPPTKANQRPPSRWHFCKNRAMR